MGRYVSIGRFPITLVLKIGVKDILPNLIMLLQKIGISDLAEPKWRGSAGGALQAKIKSTNIL